MDIQKTLKKYGIKSLYHFTDRSNLDTIAEHGLQSLENIAHKNIPVSRFGANYQSHRLDKAFGLHQFVHLSFIKDHPMYHVAKARGSIVDPVWLEIDISVLLGDDVIVSDRVANAQDTHIFEVGEMFEFIDFQTLKYGQSFQKRKEARKAEVMVLDEIKLHKIIGVHNGN